MTTGSKATINLAQLPPPNIVEPLSYESILTSMIADLQSRDDTFFGLLESDPAYKLLEIAAYRELVLRQRINDAARGVMLAFAAATDLDQIGANFNVQRLVIDPGDPDAIPAIPAQKESDGDFRGRIQLALEGITTAGSEGSYVFHGLSADGDVSDIQAVSPAPGAVTVYVLSRTGNGEASLDLVATVAAALNSDDVRPLTDSVTVQSASIVHYSVEAELTIYPGPDAEVVRQSAQDAVVRYVESVRRIGYDVTLSGIYAALHQAGVQNVNLTSPAADLIIGQGQASYCAGVTITLGGTSV